MDDDEIEDSDLLEDIAGAIHTDGDGQPIPEPVEHPSRRLQSLLMWTLYFLIVWQYCHLISDNALLMLLRFFKAFLVCIGSIIPNGAGADLVLSLAALLPMTMYSLRNSLVLIGITLRGTLYVPSVQSYTDPKIA